jgi:hypothetical protein
MRIRFQALRPTLYTLHRCAEYGKMLVRAGQIKHPDLPRF